MPSAQLRQSLPRHKPRAGGEGSGCWPLLSTSQGLGLGSKFAFTPNTAGVAVLYSWTSSERLGCLSKQHPKP